MAAADVTGGVRNCVSLKCSNRCRAGCGDNKSLARLLQGFLPEGWDVLSFATVPSRGVQRATIVDLSEATAAIVNSVEKAEQSSGIEIHSAWVGITGHHIRAYPVEVNLHLTDEEDQIKQEHLDALVERAKKARPIPEDHSVLHTIPRQFAINGVGGIRRPLGLSARENKNASVGRHSNHFLHA